MKNKINKESVHYCNDNRKLPINVYPFFIIFIFTLTFSTFCLAGSEDESRGGDVKFSNFSDSKITILFKHDCEQGECPTKTTIKLKPGAGKTVHMTTHVGYFYWNFGNEVPDKCPPADECIAGSGTWHHLDEDGFFRKDDL